MRVDVADASLSPSSTTHDRTLLFLVVVVTLASIALLIFSLRVYTCGRLLRTFGIDDWTALVAALSTIGVLTTFACLVNLGSGKSSRTEAYSSSRTSRSNAWLWVLSLFHIVGIGCVKLSVTAFLLRVFERRYCCCLLYGLAGLLIASTLTWFGSVLLRCIPVTAGWDVHRQAGARCLRNSTYVTLDFVNNAINTTTDIFLVLLLLPIICGPAVKLAIRAYLTVVLCLGIVACTTAIIRTHEVYKYFNMGKHQYTHDILSTIWSIIELTTALTASCIPALTPLFTHPFSSPPPPLKPNAEPHLANSTHHLTTPPPTLTRYHDTISNLTFDIETRTTRTLRSRGTHSRNVSDWSQFSGFTYYTDPSVVLAEGERRRSGVSMAELEDIVRGLGLGLGAGRRSVEGGDVGVMARVGKGEGDGNGGVE